MNRNFKFFLNQILRILLIIFVIFSLPKLGFATIPSSQKNNSQKETSCNKFYCVRTKQESDISIKILIKNITPYPLSIVIDAKEKDEIENAEDFPYLFTLYAKEIKKIMVNFNEAKADGNYLTLSYQYAFGDIDAVNDYIYAFPYAEDEKYYVDQAYNGGTHQGLGRYAFDWHMDEGTKVHASRSGFVIETENSYFESGTRDDLKTKANFIKILHEDHTIATYAHLQYKGVLVKKDDFVEQGQLIGYSGNTGYSTGPHLHLHVTIPVMSNKGILKEQTLPIKFHNCVQKEAFIPEVGKKYRSCSTS